MTIRRTLYPGFQDALCPVQPPASLEWLGIFDSEGFPGRKSARLVRPRILPSNYRRGAIYCPSTLIRAFGGSQPREPPLQKSILSALHFSNNSEPAILKPKQNHEIHLASIL